MSGSAVELVDDDAREDGDEDARDLRDDREDRRDDERGAVGTEERRAAGRTCARPCAAVLRGSSSGTARRVRIVLEAVPNVSEGRDAAVIDEIGQRVRERATLLDVHADRRPSPVGLHARRRPRRARRVARRRDRARRSSSSTCASTTASIRGSARSTSSRSSRSCPQRHGARRGGRARRRAAGRSGARAARSSCTARSAPDRRPAFFRRGGLDGAPAPRRGGRASPGRGPAADRSALGRGARRGPARARRVQPRSRDGRRRGRARDRGDGPRVGRRDAGRAGDRAAPAAVRARPGQHERARPRRALLSTRSSRAWSARRRSRGVAVVAGSSSGSFPSVVLADAAARRASSIPGIDESRVLERVARTSRLAACRARSS